MRDRHAWGVTGVALLALVACSAGQVTGAGSRSSDDPSTALSVPDALARADTGSGERSVAVRGFVVSDAGRTVLCEMLAESFPPQAGGAELPVDGVNLAELPGVQTSSGVTWTNAPVTITGALSDGTLVVG